MLGRVLAGLFVALPLMDVLALAVPGAGAIGMVLWGLAWAALFGFAVRCFVGLAREVAAGRWLITSAVVVLLAVSVLYHVGDPASLHHETTQEIRDALDRLAHSPDRGFVGTAHIGYPARQFLIPALPSLLLGRSLFALHFGTALCFVAALLIFASGLTRSLGHSRDPDLLVAILLSFIPHFYFFNHAMLSFEQVIFPCLFGMIVCGLALWIEEQPTAWLLWLLGLANLTLVHTYTPALALCLLVEVGLLGAALSRRAEALGGRRTLLVLAGGGAVSFVASFGYRYDVKLLGGRPGGAVVGDVLETLRHTLVAPHAREIAASPFVVFPVLLTIAASLLLLAGRRGFVLGTWAVLVALGSVAFKGYDWYAVQMRVQRAIVALPVVLCLMALLWRRNLGQRQGLRPLLVAVLLMSLPIGLAAQRDYLALREPPRQAVFLAWLDATVPTPHQEPGPVIVFELPPGDSPFDNLHDFLSYFRPEFGTPLHVRDAEGCAAVDESLRREPPRAVLVVTSTGPPAYGCFSTRPARELGTFTFRDDPPLIFRRIERDVPQDRLRRPRRDSEPGAPMPPD